MTFEPEKKSLVALALFVAAICVAAEPFERYQTVIDRKPFGPEPVNFDPEAAPGSAAANAAAAAEGEMTEEQRTAEEQQLAASVRVSMINITPAGDVAVGFTDTSVNPVENYYLKVGRSQNGWTVKSADPATESVTLEKGGVDVTVKLGETSGGGKANEAKKGRSHRPMTLQSRGGIPVASANAEEETHSRPPLLGGRPLGGLANLRKRREEEMRKAKAEAARKAEAEAAAAAEREEKAAREEEEKRIRESEEKRIRAEEAEHERKETIRQLMEQIKRDRDAKEAQQQQEEQEASSDANNVE